MIRLARYRLATVRFLSRAEAFEILKINENSDLTEVAEKYRQLAKSSNPDVPGGNEEEFLRISEAYQTLQKTDLKDAELKIFMAQYQRIINRNSSVSSENGSEEDRKIPFWVQDLLLRARGVYIRKIIFSKLYPEIWSDKALVPDTVPVVMRQLQNALGFGELEFQSLETKVLKKSAHLFRRTQYIRFLKVLSGFQN